MAGFMNSGGSSGVSPSDYQIMQGYGSNLLSDASPSMFGVGDTGVNNFSNMPLLGNVASSAPQLSGWDNFTSNFFRTKDPTSGLESGGWGGAALGLAQGLGNAFMGYQQYILGKDALKASKKQFNMNYNAQKMATNSAMEDRQAARVAANPGAYQSVGDYMNKNRIA